MYTLVKMPWYHSTEKTIIIWHHSPHTVMSFPEQRGHGWNFWRPLCSTWLLASISFNRSRILWTVGLLVPPSLTPSPPSTPVCCWCSWWVWWWWWWWLLVVSVLSAVISLALKSFSFPSSDSSSSSVSFWLSSPSVSELPFSVKEFIWWSISHFL